MELSDRLKAVAGLVSAGSVVCDVGCDHGYVPIYLVRRQICPRVIAMDINAGPLERARKNISDLYLEEYIETRRSDGVTALGAGEADCLIAAGMGGRLLIRILSDGMEKIRLMKELILQPQSDITSVRAFLREEGFYLLQEDMVYEDGKYYPMMKAVPPGEAGRATADGAAREISDGAADKAQWTYAEDVSETARQAYDKYGEYLLKHAHPVLHQYLLWEQARDESIYREITAASAVAGTPRRMSRETELRQATKVREYALTFFND